MQAKTTVSRSLLLVAGCMLAAAVHAQGVKRTIVEKQDSSIAGYETVVAAIEIEPGATAARHSHPGDEIIYVLDGETELYVDGSPPRTLKAGQAAVIPAGRIHSAKNTGGKVFKASSTYVVEKNKPLATAAPQ